MQVSVNQDEEKRHPKHDDLVPVPGVYALGDCCANVEGPLPPLAQVCFVRFGQVLERFWQLLMRWVKLAVKAQSRLGSVAQ